MTISCLATVGAQKAPGSSCQLGSECTSGACKRAMVLPQSSTGFASLCTNDKSAAAPCLAVYDDGSCSICGPGYELKNYECFKCPSDKPLSYPVSTWTNMGNVGAQGDSGGCYAETSTMTISAGDGCGADDAGPDSGLSCKSNYCGVTKRDNKRTNGCPSYCALTAASNTGTQNVFPNSCNRDGNQLTKSGSTFLCNKNGSPSFKCACCRPHGKKAGEVCSDSFECFGGDCRGSKCCAPEDAIGGSIFMCSANSGTSGGGTTTTTTTGTTSSSGTGSGGTGSGTGQSTTTTTTTTSSSSSGTTSSSSGTGGSDTGVCSRRRMNGGTGSASSNRLLDAESDKANGCCTKDDCGDCMCACQGLGGGVQTAQSIKTTENFCTSDGCTKRLGEKACPSENSQRSAMWTKTQTKASSASSVNGQMCAAVAAVAAMAAATAINGGM